MHRHQKTLRRNTLIMTMLLAALSALLMALPSRAAELVARAAQEADTLSVSWWVSGADAGPAKAATLSANGAPIAPASQVLVPDAALGACYLLMTDTSLSMKHQLSARVKPLLAALVKARPPQHLYAMARFDTDLQVLAPFGADAAALQAAVDGLALKGKRTELFRAALSGLRTLAQCEGYRRVLVMLSDGDAEDDPKAYELDDVVKAAQAQGVSIFTLGFNDTIKLQILSRLSDDTGGRHWRFERGMLDTLAAELAGSSDTGGQLLVPLANIPFDTDTLLLRTTLSDGAQLETTVKIEPIPAPAPPPEAEPWWQVRYGYLPLWAWLLGAAALGLIALLLVPRRQEEAAPDGMDGNADADAINPFVLDEPLAAIRFDGRTFLMERRTVTIGALPENDLAIDDETVSRQHATLDYRDGEFHLTDRSSANGTRVNGVAAQHHGLHDGDVIELGDWRGEFEVLVGVQT